MKPDEPLESSEKEVAMELDAWRSEWQSLGGREGLAAELADRVRSDGRRIRRGLAVEVGTGIVTSAFCVWLLVTNRNPVAFTIAVGTLVIGAVWLARLVSIRKGSLGKPAESLDAHVELTRRRLADDVRWNRFTLTSSRVGGLFLVPYCLWAFVRGYDFYAAEPWRAVVAFGGIPAILVGWHISQRRRLVKLEAERERFEALVGERTLV